MLPKKHLFYLVFLLCNPLLVSVSNEHLDINHPWQGYWRFAKEDFKTKHPWWPNFVINKALKTRLFLSKETFIQYSEPSKIYGKPRKISSILKKGPDQWLFTRKEKSQSIKFTFSKVTDIWIYTEGKKVYQLIKDSKEDTLHWKNKN